MAVPPPLRVTYTYDVMGHRVEENKWISGSGTTTTRFAYDGEQVWADLDGTNVVLARYLYRDGIDQMESRWIASGANSGRAFYLTDRLGSVRDLVDWSGNVQDHIEYDGFGIATHTNSGYAHRYGFTGREYDVDTGLQYNRARYYDSATGRWLSEDPIRLDAGDANLYRYVTNNSINNRDPSGLRGVRPTIPRPQPHPLAEQLNERNQHPHLPRTSPCRNPWEGHRCFLPDGDADDQAE
jgi:RHS repeat-associated protein